MLEETKVEAVAQTTAEVKPDAQQAPKFAPRFQGNRPNGNRPNGNRGPRGQKQHGREHEVKEFEERVVAINRISKTVKGGRKLRFSALVVIGDGKGKFGYGTGKAAEVPDAIKKALEAAKRNIFHLSMVKGDTIAHEVMGKFGACQVFLKPAPEGTGIIAGGAVRAILELAGIKNVYSKVYGSRSAINVIRATNAGIGNLKSTAGVKALRNI